MVESSRNQSSDNNSKSVGLFAINYVWLVITLLVFSSLVKLGLWQTDRAEVKEHRIERMAALKNSKAFSLSEVNALAVKQEEINDLPVDVNGAFISESIFLLDNQMSSGKYGFKVLQVVETKEGLVVVNLGWRIGDRTRRTLPNYEALSGPVSLSGHVRVIETGIVLQESETYTGAWPIVIQQIELDKIAKNIGKPLLPLVVYVGVDESIGYKKNWQPIVMPPEKHRGYAFQWFSLAVAWLALMLWASYKSRGDSESSK